MENNSNNNIDTVYDSIRESLKFVEAKNAGLIAINSGLIFGVMSVYKELNAMFHWTQILILLLLTISGLCSLLSFYPMKGIKARKKKTTSNNNVFYSEGVIGYSLKDFKTIVGASDSKIMNDQIKWIYNTARVSGRKYKLFRVAVLLTIVGVITALVCAILHYICLLVS